MTEAMLVTLGKAGIKTLDDLADLATDELIAKKRQELRRRAENAPPPRAEDKGGVLGEYGLNEEQGNEIIMAARAHWFEDEAPEAEQADDADETPVEEASADDAVVEDAAADDATVDDAAIDDAADTDSKSEDDKA